MADAPVVTPPVAPPAGDPPAPPVTPPAGDPPVAPPAGDPPKTELGAPPAKSAEAPVPFDAAKLALPEGMKADDPLVQEFAGVFSDDKLAPQDRANKMLELYTKGVKSIQEHQVNVWKETNENWIKEVKADPDIGGAKYEPTKAMISRAIDSMGPELSVAFRQGLDVTGAGNHPAIWKGIAKLAEVLTEGSHVQGNPPNAPVDINKAFFPNSQMTSKA